MGGERSPIDLRRSLHALPPGPSIPQPGYDLIVYTEDLYVYTEDDNVYTEDDNAIIRLEQRVAQLETVRFCSNLPCSEHEFR